MKHRFKCPSCKRNLETKQDLRGCEIQCGRCGHTFCLEDRPKPQERQTESGSRRKAAGHSEQWFSILDVLRVLLIVCAIICFIGSYVKLEYSADEAGDYSDAQLPFNSFVTNSRILDWYGFEAAVYWKNVEYGDTGPAQKRIITSWMADPVYSARIQKAKEADYQVPLDTRREEKIMARYQRLRSNHANLERRSTLTGRIKDALEYFAVGSMFVFAAIGVRRVIQGRKQTSGM